MKYCFWKGNRRSLWLIAIVISLGLHAGIQLASTQEAESPLSFFPRYKTQSLDKESEAKVQRAIRLAHKHVRHSMTFSTVVPKRPPEIPNQDGNLPMWSYTLTASIDGLTYSGTVVGASPFMNGARTTNIPVYIVPLIVDLPDGGVFDPTIVDKCSPLATPVAQVEGSPIFERTRFEMNGIDIGNTQYIDAFQRANFWDVNVSVSDNGYHTILYPVKILKPIRIKIPSAKGRTFRFGCPHVGVADFATFDVACTPTYSHL